MNQLNTTMIRKQRYRLELTFDVYILTNHDRAAYTVPRFALAPFTSIQKIKQYHAIETGKA